MNEPRLTAPADRSPAAGASACWWWLWSADDVRARQLQGELACQRRPERVLPLRPGNPVPSLPGAVTAVLVDLDGVDAEGALAAVARAGAPGRDLPWLVLSRCGEPLAVGRALALGARGALWHGSKPGEWVAAIDGARRGEWPLHPVLAAEVLPLLLKGPLTARPHARPSPDPCAAAAGPLPSSPLSARERQVLMHAAQGLDYPAIAQVLQLSRHTVITFARRALRKLQAQNLAQAVGRAVQGGLLAPAESADTPSVASSGVR
jgi:DNA-binding NarL/FixJ family response regulator